MKFKNDDEKELWKRCITSIIRSTDVNMYKLESTIDKSRYIADRITLEYRERNND